MTRKKIEGGADAPPAPLALRFSGQCSEDGDEHTTRKPMLLSRRSGLSLLRLAERAKSWTLLQDPPRSTRENSRRRSPRAMPARLPVHWHSYRASSLPPTRRRCRACRADPRALAGNCPTGAVFFTSHSLPQSAQLASTFSLDVVAAIRCRQRVFGRGAGAGGVFPLGLARQATVRAASSGSARRRSPGHRSTRR